MNSTYKTLFIQITLFVITLITTTLAGSEWVHGHFILFDEQGNFGINSFFTLDKMVSGIQFATAFVGILTVHEFGHYFTAKYYKIDVTLPYYIPFWFSGLLSIGTFGAFIKIKQQINSRKEFFDVGYAGPLAGIAVALVVLFYGFTHLPPAEYIFTIHPEYQQYGLDYANYAYKNLEGSFSIGTNLLFLFFENFVADPALVPNHYELMHYPFLFAGYLACFFTALNLMPIGQLDGGHILYGLVGEKWHKYISTSIYMIFVFYAGLGIINPWEVKDIFDTDTLLYLGFLFFAFNKIGGNFKTSLLIALSILVSQFCFSYLFPYITGYNGWLVFAFVLGRFLGITHPKATFDEPLDTKRKVIGYVSLVVFILCFTPKPFIFE